LDSRQRELREQDEQEKLVSKVAETIQDIDADNGECATYWSDSNESTMNYYRKMAKKVIPIIQQVGKERCDKRVDLLRSYACPIHNIKYSK